MTKFFEHPEYLEKREDWLLYKLLYEGCQAPLKAPQYLWPTELETTSRIAGDAAPGAAFIETPPSVRIRALREQRAVYDNEIEPIISRWQSIFFKEEPKLDKEVEELFGDDIKDVTGEGKSLNTFIKDDVLAARLLYGKPIILTDAPAQAPTNGGTSGSEFRPYFSIINPLAFMDWEFSSDGSYKNELKFCRDEYCKVDSRTSPQEAPVIGRYTRELIFDRTGPGSGTYYYRTYKLERGADGSKPEWTLQSEFERAGYPNLPVRLIQGEDSWIKGAAPLALKLYNLDSSCDNIHLYQAYQRIFLITSMTNEEKRAMAEFNIGFLPIGSSVATIEPVNTAAIEGRIDATISRLKLVAFNQARLMSSSGAAVESGDTQREYKEALTSLVESELETLENLINLAIKDYAWFKTGAKDFKGQIHFSREVDLSDIADEIAFYQSLKPEISAFPTWRRATLKKFARAQNLTEAKDIIDEIESGAPQLAAGASEPASNNRLLRLQQVAGNGQNQNSNLNSPQS